MAATTPELCRHGAGIEVGSSSAIGVAELSASSTKEGSSPEHGRLNSELDGSIVAWSPAVNGPEEFLQVSGGQI